MSENSSNLTNSSSVITQHNAVQPQSPVLEKKEGTEQKPLGSNVDKFASKFAALTRKEREFSQNVKQKEEEYQKRLAEVEEKRTKLSPYESIDSEISSGNKKKALEFLISKGVTPEELSEMLVTELNPDPEVKIKRTIDEKTSFLEKKIQELETKLAKEKEDEVENKKKQEEERAKLHHDEVINKVLNQLTSFVNGNVNDYTLIKQYNSIDLVYETMQAHYDEQVNSGLTEQDVKILSYKDACDKVEEYLADEVKKVYEAKWAKQEPKKEVTENKLAQTLTNTLSSEVPVSGERKLSDEDSKRAAAKLLRWVES